MTKEALAVLALPKKHNMTLHGHGWRPLDDDVVKINIDGGLFLKARKGGVGVVARSQSTYLGVWSKPLVGITNPLITEALVLWEDVSLLIFEGSKEW
jgi:hypothetical protein